MKKRKTERDEYFYSLGHAVAIADIYTLIESSEEKDRYARVTEWMNTLKRLYESKDLWQDAKNQMQGDANVSD